VSRRNPAHAQLNKRGARLFSGVGSGGGREERHAAATSNSTSMEPSSAPATLQAQPSKESLASRLVPRRRPRLRRVTRTHAPLLDDDTKRLIDGVALRFAAFLRRVEQKRSPRTIAWYQNAFAVYRKYLEDGGTQTPAQLDERIQNLDAFAEWNHARGISRITTNTYWRALRPFFNDWENLDGSPNPYRTSKAPGFDPPAPKALPDDDCARILLAASNYRRWDAFQRTRAAAVIGVMLYAGLRRSEALALTVSDVNFKTKEIFVAHGKGTRGGKKRYVPINDPLRRLLDAFLRERAKRRTTDEAPEFFSSTRKTGGMGTTTLVVIVRTLIRASGVHFSPHMLRHSFVTHLLRSDVKLHVARDLAGHSHIETTLLYTKVFAKDRHEAIQRLSFE
jgi:site-specific recombinase XerD